MAKYQPKRQVCIYVIAEEGSPDVCKIGMTGLLSRRIGGMQSSNWRKLTVIAAFALESWDTAAEIEGALLSKLSTSIIRGEWLRLSPGAVVADIETILSELEIPVRELIKSAGENDVIILRNRRG